MAFLCFSEGSGSGIDAAVESLENKVGGEVVEGGF